MALLFGESLQTCLRPQEHEMHILPSRSQHATKVMDQILSKIQLQNHLETKKRKSSRRYSQEKDSQVLAITTVSNPIIEVI